MNAVRGPLAAWRAGAPEHDGIGPRMAVLAACAVLISMAAYAQNGMRSLNNTAMMKFDEADWDLLKGAAIDVLNNPNANASKDWANSANGHHGTVRMHKAYQSPDGRECKQLRLENVAEGIKGAVNYNVCRTADGKWRLDS
jgi:surface antigen